jgi:hypothetical protein
VGTYPAMSIFRTTAAICSVVGGGTWI